MATPEKKLKPTFQKLTESEKKRRARIRSRLNRVKQVAIGSEINCWNEVKEENKLKKDIDVARLLLDFFYKHVPVTQVISSTPFKNVSVPLEQFSDVSEVGHSSDSVRHEVVMSGVEELHSEPDPIITQSSAGVPQESTKIDQLQILVELHDESDGSTVSSDSDDPTYSPSYCDISMHDTSLDDLDDVEMEDVIFPIEDHQYQYEDPGEQPKKGKLSTRRITNINRNDLEQNYITFHSCLKDLAELKSPTSCHAKGCKGSVDFYSRKVGTGDNFIWRCTNGHEVLKWSSQPILPRGIFLGDFLMATSVILSGNNFTKVALLFKFLNIGFVSKTTFHQMQAHYVTPGIDEYWANIRAGQLLDLSDKEVILAGDGRMDSPGFCAKYCTYTAVDIDSMKIVDLVVVDKRETALKSTAMESKAFVTVLQNMKNAGLNVIEVVTDAHPQISSIMKKQYPLIKHSYDVWHGAKNLGKKLATISSEKGCKDLKPWIGHVTNHFWYCSRECNGNADTFVTQWQGLLHHVVDEHSWALGCCEHAPLLEHTTKWMEANSTAHVALRKQVLNTRFLHNIPYYVTFRSTSVLENFQNHILMYASKRFSYRKFSKQTNHWTVCEEKEMKHYTYIPELMMNIVNRYLTERIPLRHLVTVKEDDPKKIRKTVAPVSPEPSHILAAKKVSRFSKRT